MTLRHFISPVLIALAAAEAGNAAPEWIQLLPRQAVTGEPWHGGDGRGPYRVTDVAAFIRNSCAAGADGRSCDIALDYDHQLDRPEAAGQAKVASGWIKQIEARADGIWGRIEWTPRAATAIADKEFRFFSPAIAVAEGDDVVAIVGGGLVNRPNFTMAALANAETNLGNQEISMNPDMLAALRTALNLPANAEGTAIVTAAQDLGRTIAALAAPLKLAGKSHVELAAAAATQLAVLDPSKFVDISTHSAVVKERDDLKKAASDAAIAAVVDTAIKEGRLSPAQRDPSIALAAKDLDGFKALVLAQPTVLKPGAQHTDLATHASTGVVMPAGADRVALHSRAIEHQKKNPTLSYEQAVRAVSSN